MQGSDNWIQGVRSFLQNLGINDIITDKEFSYQVPETAKCKYRFVTGIRKFTPTFFIPTKNFAIQCYEPKTEASNGPSGKDIFYHWDLTECYSKNNIKVFHLWDCDWYYKNDLIKSMLAQRLGCITNKIYARKCELKHITRKELNSFLEENHIQGKTGSTKYVYGLFYNNELVSVMNFCKGIRNKQWSLDRFCSKKWTIVVGAADKLFKIFLKEHPELANEDTPIYSYADRFISHGDLYYKLGFKLKCINPVDYRYYFPTLVPEKLCHKSIGQKSALIYFFPEMGFTMNVKEREMVNRLGPEKILVVQDAGKMVFVYKRGEIKN